MKKKDSENLKAALQFFDASPCGYIFTDDNALILRINESFCRWLGWKREELEGKKRFTDLLSVGGRVYYQTTHAPLSKLQSDVRELSYKMLTKDKKRIPILVNSTRQKTEGRNEFLISQFFQFTDFDKDEIKHITQFVIFPFLDRQKFEKELLNAKNSAEKASAARSVFLSTMTHELRNPIHSILNAGNILASENLTEDQRELADIVHFSAQGLLELVNSVLDLSKMEAGKINLTEKPFDLYRLLHLIIQSFRPQAEQKGLRLSWDVLTETPLQFVGDEMKIKQVITNLIGNAIKFTSEGFVRLSLDYLQETEELLFKIEDSGIGINPNIVDKIFTPFSQANDSIHTNFGGTGLGLSISKKILEAYNTKLIVTGEEGKGAIFSFKLKLTRTQKLETPQKVLPNLEFRPLTQLKVLVADDVKSNLIIVGRYFKDWQLSYDEAMNGREAVDLILENDYDIVFLDISMPVMSGYDAAKQIRKQDDPKYQKLPLIALTAFDTKEMEKQVAKSGMNGVLQKPFSNTELYETICMYSLKNRLPDVKLSKAEVDFSQLYEFFENDIPDIKRYLQAVINDLNKTELDFAKAEEEFNLKLYGDATHKMLSLNRMLKLKGLQDLLTRQRQFLEADNRTSFAKIAKKRKEMMQDIKEMVQLEMKK